MTFLITFVLILIQILNIAIIARVLVSWLNLRPDHPVLIFLYQITEPILAPLRRVLPSFGMIDISPIVAILLLNLIGRVVASAF